MEETRRTVEQWREYMKDKTCITFSGEKGMRQGIRSFAEALHGNGTIRKLDMKYLELGNEAIKVLAPALPAANIVHLDLRDNLIGLWGMQALAKALWGNRTLRVLNLHNNMLGCDGTSVLASLVETMALVRLIVSSNSIKTEGSKALVTMLRKNYSMIDLRYDGYYHKGKYNVAFARYLGRNQCIRDHVMSVAVTLCLIGKTQRTRRQVQKECRGRPVPREVFYAMARAISETRNDSEWFDAYELHMDLKRTRR